MRGAALRTARYTLFLLPFMLFFLREIGAEFGASFERFLLICDVEAVVMPLSSCGIALEFAYLAGLVAIPI